MIWKPTLEERKSKTHKGIQGSGFRGAGRLQHVWASALAASGNRKLEILWTPRIEYHHTRGLIIIAGIRWVAVI